MKIPMVSKSPMKRLATIPKFCQGDRVLLTAPDMSVVGVIQRRHSGVLLVAVGPNLEDIIDVPEAKSVRAPTRDVWGRYWVRVDFETLVIAHESELSLVGRREAKKRKGGTVQPSSPSSMTVTTKDQT